MRAAVDNGLSVLLGADWLARWHRRQMAWRHFNMTEYGISTPEARLFPSERCSGYFATKRFDRCRGERVHMVSASGLLDVSHRVPALDYRSLFQLSYYLSRSYEEVEQLFRRMCFNVFAHNHDDHSNNFSWLCEGGSWRLSPAYDLTYSRTVFGGHTTTVGGEVRPGVDDVLGLAQEAGIPLRKAVGIVHEIQEHAWIC